MFSILGPLSTRSPSHLSPSTLTNTPAPSPTTPKACNPQC